MIYIEFKGNTDKIRIVNPPKNAIEKDIQLIDIPVKISKDGLSLIVCGQLNKEEIDQINETGKIYLQLPIMNDKIGVPNGTLLKPNEIEDDINDDTLYLNSN